MALTRIILTVALLVAAGEARKSPARRSLSERHEQWMSAQGKVYKDASEKEKRAQIFAQNEAYVEEFNSRGAKPYKLKANRYADMTNEEFHQSQTAGYVLSDTERATVSHTESSSLFDQSLDSLPAQVDWRKEGVVSSVKFQGLECGCCWAFAAIATVESLMAIKKGSLPALSPQQLIDCARDNPNTRGCGGGNQDDAYKYIIKNNGINAADNYPYKAADGTCDASRTSNAAARITGLVNLPPNDEAALMRAVAQQPVAAFINSKGQDFQLYAGGVYTGPCDTTLDHVVTIVGYGVEDGIKYWLLKNSWGVRWGEDGYMKIERNSGEAEGRCGIAAYTSYPTLSG